MADQISLRRPDDWHVHLRDGAMLAAVAPYTAHQFGRAVIMPNLVPPITTPDAALAYRARIKAALPPASHFEPLMTLYLTDDADPEVVERGYREGAWIAAKLYPARATTNSHFGVTDIARIAPALERMERIGMPLLVHGEVTDPDVDVFDREAVFLEQILIPLRHRLPDLRIVFEHVTTEEAASYVAEAAPGIAATVTPHHLVINRNALFTGGLRPHAYCLPVAKRERHRQALRRAATGTSGRFFLGTDTAPHLVAAKEADCGCAGIFCAPAALEVYATVFEECGALDRLEAFASLNGPGFYGLPPNSEMVTLVREPATVPELLAGDLGGVKPFLAGETLPWRFIG